VAGRPRTIDDDRIFAAVATAVGKVGPARLTLADVAREAHASTGAIAQRFGNKRNLLLSFLRASDILLVMRAAYVSAPDPVTGLVRAVVASAGPDRSPEEFANHLAFLHLDLTDSEFRAVLAEQDAAIWNEMVGYLQSGVAQELLVVDDVDALASAINSLRSGTQITWAIGRRGSLADALRRDLNALLAPYHERAMRDRPEPST